MLSTIRDGYAAKFLLAKTGKPWAVCYDDQNETRDGKWNTFNYTVITSAYEVKGAALKEISLKAIRRALKKTDFGGSSIEIDKNNNEILQVELYSGGELAYLLFGEYFRGNWEDTEAPPQWGNKSCHSALEALGCQ